ncbi:hypothetical protein C8R41DRAFT_518428 [Lentinula lateritia]|uniref:Secreted protein n=1 Tax=Lentinula lateritia TaxID=40482 RepID=A0ABQ8V974_9AGAR|nr:hypothetical protein C8R41DRAFT_518428 [Lentinula lateritia]
MVDTMILLLEALLPIAAQLLQKALIMERAQFAVMRDRPFAERTCNLQRSASLVPPTINYVYVQTPKKHIYVYMSRHILD